MQQALLVIEENQPTLRTPPEEILTEECEAQFKSGPHTAHRTADGDHRRIESRQGWVLGDPEYLLYVAPQGHWPNLHRLLLVETERRAGGQVKC